MSDKQFLFKNITILLSVLFTIFFYFQINDFFTKSENFIYPETDITRNTFLDDDSCNIAVIPISGVIVSNINPHQNATSSEQLADASLIIQKIKDANDAANIKAVLFDINSPGGVVTATERIANEIKQISKEKIAAISDMALSAGYFIASGADKIISQPSSEIGSIGVTQSYLETKDENTKFIDISTGPYKTLMDPARNISEKEIEFLKNKLEVSEDIFVENVSKNRNKTFDEIKKLATGEIWTGKEAMTLGLVDILGFKKEVDLEFTNILNKDNFSENKIEPVYCY
jgi:protease-4